MSAFNLCSVSSAIGPTRENEFFRKVPPVRITSIDEPESFGGNVHCVGNDRQMLQASQGARNSRGGGAGIKNHHLPFCHHACRGGGNLQLFFAVQLFFFPQAGIV